MFMGNCVSPSQLWNQRGFFFKKLLYLLLAFGEASLPLGRTWRKGEGVLAPGGAADTSGEWEEGERAGFSFLLLRLLY